MITLQIIQIITDSNIICYIFSFTIKKQLQKEAVLTQKKSLSGYRSLSTDFTSLSSFLIKIFAKNKQITAINGKTGSIPFSGKLIPPDKFCTQYTNTPINKAFIIMLTVFSKICLFLFLKLNRLNAPIKTKITDDKLTIGALPKTSTSCPVIYKKAADNTDSKIQIVCILCNIEF